MLDDRRNSTLIYRAGILFGLSCLLLIHSASAQVGDTVRVGEDTVRADQDTTTVAASDKEYSVPVAEDSASPVLRHIPDSVADKWRKDPDFAYANDPAWWRRLQNKDESPGLLWRLLASTAFKYFLWILLGAALLYAIIRIIAENNMRLFYRSPRKMRDAAVQDDQPELAEEDLEGQLQHFLQTGDHRQAVRYLYLKSLRLMSDRGLIRYHQQTTNREYLAQMGDDPHRGPFGDLTIAYEKVWYGEFPLTDGQFGRLHQYFEEFFKTVRS